MRYPPLSHPICGYKLSADEKDTSYRPCSFVTYSSPEPADGYQAAALGHTGHNSRENLNCARWVQFLSVKRSLPGINAGQARAYDRVTAGSQSHGDW